MTLIDRLGLFGVVLFTNILINLIMENDDGDNNGLDTDLGDEDRDGGGGGSVEVASPDEPIADISISVRKTASELGLPREYAGSAVVTETFTMRSDLLGRLMELASTDPETLAEIRMEGGSEARANARDVLDGQVFDIPLTMSGPDGKIHTGVAFEAIASWGVDKLARVKAIRSLKEKGQRGDPQCETVLSNVAHMRTSGPSKYKDSEVSKVAGAALSTVRDPEDEDLRNEAVRAECELALKELRKLGDRRLELIPEDADTNREFIEANRSKIFRYELFLVSVASIIAGEEVDSALMEDGKSHIIRRFLMNHLSGSENMVPYYRQFADIDLSDDFLRVMDAIMSFSSEDLINITSSLELLRDVPGTVDQKIEVLGCLSNLSHFESVMREVFRCQPGNIPAYVGRLDLGEE